MCRQLDLFPETLPVVVLTEQQIEARRVITELAQAMLTAPRSMHLEDAEAGAWNTHEFYPGLYVRSIYMKAGSRIMSHTHLTKHPFIILKGRCRVADTQGNAEVLEAPFMGVTLPDTQRVLFIEDDTWWITVHPNPDNLDDPDAIMARITSMDYA